MAKKLLVIVLLIIAYYGFPAAAVTPVFYGEELIVTAARIPQFRGESPWSVTVLTEEDLEATGASSLGEALRQVVGADIKSAGYGGAVRTLRMRGGNAEAVLILVDGMRVSSTLLGQADLTDIPVGDIERVEIVRGASSAIFGSDAVGGVVNIITKGPSDEGRSQVEAGYGAYGRVGLGFSTRGKLGFGYSFNALYDRGDGFRKNSDFDSQKCSGALEFDLGKEDSLRISGDMYLSRKGIPNVPTVESEPESALARDDRQEDRNAGLSIAYLSPGIELKAYQTQAYQLTHVWGGSEFTDSSYFSVTNALEGKQVLTLSGDNRLTWGVDWREETGRSFYAGEHTVNNIALYAQDEAKLSEDTSLNLGVRGDAHSVSGDYISSRIGFLYRASPNMGLRTTFGTSFRSPTINELYYKDDSWMMYGSEDLSPERGEVLDLGVTYGDGHGLDSELTYFTSKISDMIYWPLDMSTWKSTAANIDTAVIQGVEFNLSQKPFDWFWYSVNATGQNPVRAYDEREPSLTGKDLPYTPRSKWNASICFGDEDDKTLGITGRYVGLMYADGANTQRIREHTVVDLRFTRVLERIEFDLIIENLFDTVYFESVGYNSALKRVIGYPMPGRTAGFRVKYEL